MRYEPDVISKNIKKSQKCRKILILILYLMLIPTIVFSLFLIVVELGNSDEVPSFFNIDVYTISSESMKPKLNINDIIVVKKGYENKEYKIGNIITFKNSKGELITHRISKISTVSGNNTYITKGDNNEVEDDEIVEYKDIIGKVIYVMPKFGTFVAILKNKFFFISCIILLIVITIYDIRVKKRKIDRKKIREKYEKKSNFYF